MLTNKFKKQLIACTLGLLLMTSTQAEELIVSGAASLSNAFKEIGAQFEAKYPNDKVLFNFAASGTLLQQMTKGAPVDVFASADQETMDQAVAKNLITHDSRKNFTQNTLVAIVPIKSNLSLNTLANLDEPTIKRIALGNPASVPAGRYTEQALTASGQWKALESKYIYTQNVRQALDYVARNEVDVGFVYGSDAAIMKDKVKVAFTVPLKTTITYPIAELSSSKHSKLAAEFIAFVLSQEGQNTLAKYGFTPLASK